MITEKIDKHNYYLDICETTSGRGTCLRRNFAAFFSKKWWLNWRWWWIL